MMFFGPNAESPPKKTLRERRLVRHRIDLRHAPLVELETEVALDPRKGILLADRDQHVVALEVDVRLAGRLEPAASLVVGVGGDLLEEDAGQLARRGG